MRELKKNLETLYTTPEAQAIALRLAEYISEKKYADLILEQHTTFSEKQHAAFSKAASLLLQGQPLQYVTGQTEFLGRIFHVNQNVLIPRPETEELVSWVIDSHPEAGLRVLDAGTGSGAIAISLALGLNRPQVSATDASASALKTAMQNALSLQARVDFIHQSWLDSGEAFAEKDIIVSNPPYIPPADASAMHPNVLDHEPHLALFTPENDPLIHYRHIIRRAKSGSPHAWVYFEIHAPLYKEMEWLMKDEGLSDVELKKDIHGKFRMIRGRLRDVIQKEGEGAYDLG